MSGPVAFDSRNEAYEDMTELGLHLQGQYLRFVRPDVVESLVAYRDTHRPLGDFLRYVVENDLSGACGHADAHHIATMWAVMAWVYNYLPSDLHGSRVRYEGWLARRPG